MGKPRISKTGLGLVLAVTVGLVATAWATAIWLERTLSIPAQICLGIFFGAIALIEVFKRINRRDDPRHAKRPPEEALDVVELVMDLEDKFKIAVPDEDYQKIKTVDDAMRYFEERKGTP